MNHNYYGLPTITLENAQLRVDALASAGPRLVRAIIHGNNENQFAELPGLKIETPLGPYSVQGGHRLWHAPEAMPRTYIPDDHGLTAVIENGTLTLAGMIEQPTQIQKMISLRLLEDRPGLVIEQTIRNTGPWAIELACWGITQLPLGGMAILPQAIDQVNRDALLPDRSLVLWPYTHLNDARLHFYDDMLLIKGNAMLPPCKIGYANDAGWAGYLRNGVLFVKHLDNHPSAYLPDRGCNTEVYVNHLFLELETLGNLLQLPPDQSTTITERWEFYTGLSHIPYSVKGARTLIHELGLSG